MKFITIITIALLIVAGCRCVCSADEVTPVPDTISTKIVLPMTPVLVEPDAPPAPQPVPQPSVEPRVVTSIPFDCWWVIESQEELLVDQVPGDFVNVEQWASTPEEKSVRMMGRFADGLRDAAGNLKTETRVYRSPFVYFVTAKTKGQTTIIIDPRGMLELSQRIKTPLIVTDGTQPNPPPVPDPDDPIVPDPPGPVTPAKLQIAIIEDPSESIPAAQVAIRDGQALRDYAATHCTITNGTPDIRKLSIRQDVSSQPEWIKKAFAEPRSKLPFLVVSNGKAGAAVPLPMTLEETMTILKKYGGE